MMKNSFKKLFLGLLLFAAGSIPAFAAEGTYYTKVNIWYEKPEKVLTTNYHKGAMVPVGSEVQIKKSNKKKIQFVDKNGTEITLVLAEKYTPLGEQQFFDRYFSKENILNTPQYTSLSGKEKEAIKAGKIEKGMSKEAVLLAYGHPPAHRTPTTAQDTWTYWNSRYGNFLVHFKDNKVEDAIGSDHW